MSDISLWYKNLPIFTRWWLTLTIAFTLLGRFGFLPVYQLILVYEPIVKQFQFWRLFTSVFFYPLQSGGFHFLINCYFLYNYSLQLERGVFNGRPADYLFLLVFNWAICIIIGLIGEIPLLMEPMVLSVLYIWCQLNKETIVNFWFGTRFKAMYLPWVLFAFNFIISGGGIVDLVGILVGHLYFFLAFQYPQEFGGPQLIQTPQIFTKWFPNQTTGIFTFGAPPIRRPQADNPDPPGRHRWGRGQVLGND